MKIKAIFIMILLISVSLFGCKEKRIATKNDVEFLTAPEYWWFYDVVTGESEKMSFGKNFSFYRGCECGEPIGYSDNLEVYDYDKETKTIKLYNNFDDTSMELKVIDYNDYYLMLEMEGKIKGYTSLNGMEGAAFFDKSEEYLSEYNMYSSILKLTENGVVTAPFNYDGDVQYPDEAFRTYKLSDNIEFYDLQIKIVENIDQGTEDQTVSYNKLSKEDGLKALEHTFGFIWFDDDMKIKKITYYGDIRIQE